MWEVVTRTLPTISLSSEASRCIDTTDSGTIEKPCFVVISLVSICESGDAREDVVMSVAGEERL